MLRYVVTVIQSAYMSLDHVPYTNIHLYTASQTK